MIFGAEHFRNAKEFYGSYLKAGKYTVRVKNIEEIASKKNNNPQFKITFWHRLSDTEFIHFANADISNETSRNWIYSFALACGHTNFSNGLDMRTLINQPVNIEIKPKYNEYKGKVYNQLSSLEQYDQQKGAVNIEYDDDALRKEEELRMQARSSNDFMNSNAGYSAGQFAPPFNSQSASIFEIPQQEIENTFGTMQPTNMITDDDLPF